jgi:hypothetical protein
VGSGSSSWSRWRTRPDGDIAVRPGCGVPSALDTRSSILTQLDEVVRRRPDAYAARFADADLTWAELDQRSNALALRLHAELGPGPEPVAIAGVSGPDMIIAPVAVLKSGRPYTSVVARGTGHADPVPRRGSKRHCRRPWLRARRRDVLSRVVPASGRAINGKRRTESSRRCDGPREHRFHLGFDRHAERRCRTAPLSPSSRCHLRRARLWLGRSRRTDAAILTSLRIHTCSPVLSRQRCKPGSVQRATRSERYCESIGRSHSARSIGAPGVPCRRLRGCSTRARPTKCDGGVIP